RNVPAVANDVHEQRTRDLAADLRNVEYVVGVVDRPALRSLMIRDGVHHDADEIAPGPAFGKQLRAERLGLQTGTPKTFALHPRADDLFAAAGVGERTEAGLQAFVDGKISAINGESAGRKQGVIQKMRSRAMTTHNEDRTLLPLNVSGMLVGCGLAGRGCIHA